MKNNISKLALLTGLLMINTNTKGFYQCVPKHDWFKKQYYILTLEEKFKTAKKQINNHNLWRLVEENKTSGSLDVGIYKVILKAGDGGSSGRSQDGTDGDGHGYFVEKAAFYPSNSGSTGEISIQVFLIKTKKSYNACFGRKGNNAFDGIGGEGGYTRCTQSISDISKGNFERFCTGGSGGGAATGGQGGGGSGSSFQINDININLKGGVGGLPSSARGGKGGKGNASDTIEESSCLTPGFDAENLDNNLKNLGIGGSGCQKGNAGSDGNKGKGARAPETEDFCNPNNICSLICDEIVIEGEEDTTLKLGGKGGDGFAGKGGAGGELMKDGEKSNSGDGYVKIYKYIG